LLTYDFEASVGYWLLRTAREYERAVNAELAPHGITFRQCQVLGWLALELVTQLDRMESDGWIERVACSRDRRKNLVRPSRGVLPVWSKIVACAKRVRERATRGFDARKLGQLKSLLDAVRRNLAAAYPERPEDHDDASHTNALDRPRDLVAAANGHRNGHGPRLGSAANAAGRGGRRRRKTSAASRPVRGHG
jgi:MarR family transcriptional regulator for hemolysin